MEERPLDAGGQVFHSAVADVGRDIDANLAAGGEAAGLLQLIGEPGPAIAFYGHGLAAVELLQLFDEPHSVDQKRLAGLESAKPVHEPDRGSPLDAQYFFEDGSIHHRSRELPQLFQS
jgi:hypothetical protein